MAIPNQADFLAHAGNADVAAYVNNGGNFNDWWNNHGQHENRQWQVPANQAVGAGPQPVPAPTPAPYAPDLSYVDWTAYANANPDLEAAGLTTKDQLVNHWQTYGQFENGRSLGFQPLVNNQGQFYNYRDGTPIGPTSPEEMDAFVNGNFTNHTGFDPETMAGTGGGIGGLGGLGGAPYDRNAFDPNAFMGQIQSMFGNMQNQWQQQQNSMWDQFANSNLNQWGQMAYNGAGQANNGFQAGQPTNQSPVYNPNPNGNQPRNGFGGPLGNNNPWSPTF